MVHVICLLRYMFTAIEPREKWNFSIGERQHHRKIESQDPLMGHEHQYERVPFIIEVVINKQQSFPRNRYSLDAHQPESRKVSNQRPVCREQAFGRPGPSILSAIDDSTTAACNARLIRVTCLEEARRLGGDEEGVARTGEADRSGAALKVGCTRGSAGESEPLRRGQRKRWRSAERRMHTA